MKNLSMWLDLRMIIAIVFAIFGVLLLVYGYAFTTTEMLQKSASPSGDTVNLNLWTGWGMLVVSACFASWNVIEWHVHSK